jgi:glycosyltransferase involved in cell wall biosynthesis
LSVTVVIPVRNGIELIGPCLATVLAEATVAGASVVVVDDNSTDGTAAAATAAGAEVVSLTTSVGPYAARNAGWRSNSADVVVFTDVRCRARRGWLDAIVTALDDPSVALASGISIVSSGPSLGARAMHRLQPLDSRRAAEHSFLPWAAGANLAVRRDVLVALGGFRDIRSGGDVDLCWRAQLELGGRLAVVEAAVVDWEPRRTVSEGVAQWYRYGRHHPALYQRFASYGAVLPVGKTGPLWAAVLDLWSLPRAVRRQGLRQLDVELALAAFHVAETAGHWVGARELRRREQVGRAR